MGYAYDEQKNYSKAITWYQKAIEIDPNLALAYFNMGYAYDNQGNHSQKITCFQKAARLGYTGAQKWLNKNGHSW
jgi:superkiller protein 3